MRTIQELSKEGRGEGQVSVIVPTLNAADTLPGLIEQLRTSAIVKEVIVADGGSSDETVPIAAAAGARVIEAARGRGIQLAAGADVSAAGVSPASAGGALLRHGATAEEDTGVARCATCSASRSISPGYRLTGSCGSTADAAHPRSVRAGAAARQRQAPPRARGRRCRGDAFRAVDDRAAVAPSCKRRALAVADRGDARQCLPSRPSLVRRGRGCRTRRGGSRH